MSKVATKDCPKGLRTFRALGMELTKFTDSQARDACPFCGSEKFYVNLESGLWDCKPCGLSGNPIDFIRWVWDVSFNNTDIDSTELSDLSTERGFIFYDTPYHWGLSLWRFGNQWVLPSYNFKSFEQGADDPKGLIYNLYIWTRLWDEKKNQEYFAFLPCPGVHSEGKSHGLFAPLLNHWDSDRPDICVCEGAWDGMFLWETFRADLDRWNKSNVCAVPGCNVFPQYLYDIFRDRRTLLFFDSDWPKNNNGIELRPGYDGMKRVARSLVGNSYPPSEIGYLRWDRNEGGRYPLVPAGVGYDHTLPSGYDLRDELKKGKTVEDRLDLLGGLLERCLEPIPSEWSDHPIFRKGKGSVQQAIEKLEPVECSSWEEVVAAWEKAKHWTPDLQRVLAVMYATILSTFSKGDQLWMLCISPPSTGKTMLCEGLAVAEDYTESISTFRGFFSGYKTDKEGEADYSLIEIISGKTMITKDGDTFMTIPNLAQVIAEARDVYDGSCRAVYRQGLDRKYKGRRITWIMCGTRALYGLDSTELGSRFVHCILMHEIDTDLEDKVARSASQEAFASLGMIVNGKMETQLTAEEAYARQVTGGYAIYLRENDDNILSNVRISEEDQRTIERFAIFTSYARTKPGKDQTSNVAEREFSPRLIKQLSRLAGCLCGVFGRTQIDKEVMAIVRRTAIDTANGQTLDVILKLYEAWREGEEGVSSSTLANDLEISLGKLKPFIRFLRRNKIVRAYYKDGIREGSKPKWVLTDRMLELCMDVIGETEL